MTPRQILGVGPTATEDECKAAFRKLARQYHPDVNKEPGAEEKFKAITEAWEIIQRPESASNRRASARAAYARTEYTRVYNFTPPHKPRTAVQMSTWNIRGKTLKLQAIINELTEWSRQRGFPLDIEVKSDTHIVVQLTADPGTIKLVHLWLATMVSAPSRPPHRTTTTTAKTPVQTYGIALGQVVGYVAVASLMVLMIWSVVSLVMLLFGG